MKLYFLRHGQAGQRDEWTGDDVQRPLTKDGKERMAREAVTMAKLCADLEWIITSPLVRANQTAEIVAQELHRLDKLVKDERLAPGFGLDQLAQVLKTHSNAGALMLVGHEPDLSEVIGRLIGGGRVECKKGSLVRVDIADPSSLEGDLIWLLPPQVLAL